MNTQVMSVETVMPVAVKVEEFVAQRGRPVVADSERQKRLAARAERAAANGGEVKRGRPANPTSARQAKIAEKLAKMAAGEVIKRGRPKMAKEEVVETPQVEEVVVVIEEQPVAEVKPKKAKAKKQEAIEA